MNDSGIRVRSYNVGCGDCFLVTFPDGRVTRNMLVGFSLGADQPKSRGLEIAKDIQSETNGHLDVVVVTHDHRDQFESFLALQPIFDKTKIGYLWLSQSSSPVHRRPRSRTADEELSPAERLQEMRDLTTHFQQRMSAKRVKLAPSFAKVLRNNVLPPDCLDYVRGLVRGETRTLYLHRGSSVLGRPFSSNVHVQILSPERNLGHYFRDFSRQGFTAMTRRLPRASRGAISKAKSRWAFPTVRREPGPPPNLTDREWRLLEGAVQSGAVQAIYELDRVADSMSLAFTLQVSDQCLLFSGDATRQSWVYMEYYCKDELDEAFVLDVSFRGTKKPWVDFEL